MNESEKANCIKNLKLDCEIDFSRSELGNLSAITFCVLNVHV